MQPAKSMQAARSPSPGQSWQAGHAARSPSTTQSHAAWHTQRLGNRQPSVSATVGSAVVEVVTSTPVVVIGSGSSNVVGAGGEEDGGKGGEESGSHAPLVAARAPHVNGAAAAYPTAQIASVTRR